MTTVLYTKNKFFTMFALAATVSLASCSNDEVETGRNISEIVFENKV